MGAMLKVLYRLLSLPKDKLMVRLTTVQDRITGTMVAAMTGGDVLIKDCLGSTTVPLIAAV